MREHETAEETAFRARRAQTERDARAVKEKDLGEGLLRIAGYYPTLLWLAQKGIIPDTLYKFSWRLRFWFWRKRLDFRFKIRRML